MSPDSAGEPESADLQSKSFWELSWPYRAVRVFNRTALGAGALLAGWHLVHRNWVPGVALLLMIPVYFYLHDRVDAP